MALCLVGNVRRATRAGIVLPRRFFQACQLRFRPIMMTTMAALLGAFPLAIGAGEGAERRRPLGDRRWVDHKPSAHALYDA
jgi:multidrug efflux pump subunit AcrB